MQRSTVIASMFGLVAALATSASAQDAPVHVPGTLMLPRMTPLAVNEPRALSPAAQIEAKPLPVASSSDPRRQRPPQPPVNLRLVSSEETVAAPSGDVPRRLAPKTDAAREPLAEPAAATPSAAIGTVVASLAIVLGVFLAIVWCTRGLNPGGQALLPKEAVEVLGRTALVGRQQMQLVRVGHKLILLAVSPTTAVALAEVSDPAEVEHLRGLCRGGLASSASAAFREALQQLSTEPAPRGFAPTAASARGAR